MFVADSMVCNYAEDTIIYLSYRRHEGIIRRLETDIATLIDWFTNQDGDLSINIDNETITESKDRKLLGVNKDKAL